MDDLRGLSSDPPKATSGDTAAQKLIYLTIESDIYNIPVNMEPSTPADPANLAPSKLFGLEGPASHARLRILNVAISLFAERGVRDTSLQLVADKAEVSRQTVYRQFGTSDTVEQIYDAVVQRVLREIATVVEHATAGHGPKDEDYWISGAKAFVAYFDRKTNLANVFFGPRSNARTRLCNTIRREVCPVLGRLLEERYGPSRLRAPLTVANQFSCSLLQIMHSYVHQIEELSQDDVVDLILTAPAVAPPPETGPA